MRAPAYLLTLAGTILVLAVATAALTIWVDPYRMFGTPPVQGLTVLKPRAFEQMDIAKTYQLERIAPKTLLLGNSRTEIGLDPTSGEFPADWRPVFNAAFAGRDVCTSLLMLRDAIAVHVPERVILGMDFQDVLSAPRPASATVAPSSPWSSNAARRLLVDDRGRPNPQRAWQVWKDRLAATLTIDALLDSVTTLLNQDPVTGATITTLGFNPLHEYRVFVERGGYYSLFSQKIEIYRKQYAAYAKPDFAHPSPTMMRVDKCFLQLARLAVENHIVLTLYIHPYHAIFLDMLDHFGLWEGFEAWKRHLVAQVAGLDPAGEEIQIIDFSGYDKFTTEAVPGRGDAKSEMHWYWEPGHYKSALGEHILQRILHGGTDFGRILTAANIDSALAEMREERDRMVRVRGTPGRGMTAASFGPRS